MVQHMQIKECNTAHKQTERQMQKGLWQSSTPSPNESPEETRKEGTGLNTTKAIQDKPGANFITKWEERDSSLLRTRQKYTLLPFLFNKML